MTNKKSIRIFQDALFTISSMQGILLNEGLRPLQFNLPAFVNYNSGKIV